MPSTRPRRDGGAEALIHDLGYARVDGPAGAHVVYAKTLLMPEAA